MPKNPICIHLVLGHTRRMKKYLVLLLLLSGCDSMADFQKQFGASSPAAAKKAAEKPGTLSESAYSYSSKPVGPDQYEIAMDGKPGVKVEMLKMAFKTKGSELCGSKVYLLRGMREESDPAHEHHRLNGLVDCVGLDYFK